MIIWCILWCSTWILLQQKWYCSRICKAKFPLETNCWNYIFLLNLNFQYFAWHVHISNNVRSSHHISLMIGFSSPIECWKCRYKIKTQYQKLVCRKNYALPSFANKKIPFFLQGVICMRGVCSTTKVVEELGTIL